MSIRARFSLIIMTLMVLAIITMAYTFMTDVISDWIILIALFVIILLGAWAIIFFTRNILKPIAALNDVTKALDKADSTTLEKYYSQELNQVFANINDAKSNLDDATNFVTSIGEGKFDAEIGTLDTEKGLGKALLQMRSQLQGIAEEERARNWAINGIAKFSTLLRDNQNESLEDISFFFIRELVKYVRANQGAVYLIDDNTQDPHIISIAAYAYERRKHISKRLEINEGLVGRCIRERDIVYMDDIPQSYLSITSGLGKANPKSLLLVPVMVNENIYGAIELASFRTIKDYEQDFILQTCQNLAATVANSKVSNDTKRLLAESQEIAKELRSKEDILEQKTQELYYTQDQLKEKILEIEKESIRTKSIVDAVNKTNATIELDMEGRIIDVNEIYLSISEYTRDELIGRSEKELVPDDEKESGRFDVMWESISEGAFNSGEFKRISKTGRELWLTGTYSPILDIEGAPDKIVQFAQFTTEQKEKELEYSSKIMAINESIPLIEMKLDGQLIRANSMFMKQFAFKRRSEIRKTNIKALFHKDFIETKEFLKIFEDVKQGKVVQISAPLYSKDEIKRNYNLFFSPTKKVDGTIYKIIIMMFDITPLYNKIISLEEDITNEQRDNTILLLEKGFGNETIAQIASVLSIDDVRKQGQRLKIISKSSDIPSLRVEVDGLIFDYNKSFGKLLGEKRLQNETYLQNWLIFDSPEVRTDYDNVLTSQSLTQKRLKMRVNEYIVITFNALVATIYKSDSSKRFDKLFILLNIENVVETDPN